MAQLPPPETLRAIQAAFMRTIDNGTSLQGEAKRLARKYPDITYEAALLVLQVAVYQCSLSLAQRTTLSPEHAQIIMTG